MFVYMAFRQWLPKHFEMRKVEVVSENRFVSLATACTAGMLVALVLA